MRAPPHSLPRRPNIGGVHPPFTFAQAPPVQVWRPPVHSLMNVPPPCLNLPPPTSVVSGLLHHRPPAVSVPNPVVRVNPLFAPSSSSFVNELEFAQIMARNRTVSASAVARAISVSCHGLFVRISLFLQSRILR